MLDSADAGTRLRLRRASRLERPVRVCLEILAVGAKLDDRGMFTRAVAHRLAVREESEHRGAEHEAEVEEKERLVVVLDRGRIGEVVAMNLERARLLENRRGRPR